MTDCFNCANRGRRKVVLEMMNRRLVVSPLICVLLLGCGRSQGQSSFEYNTSNAIAKKPDAATLLAITAPAYNKAGTALQECLGRVVFEVGAGVQWPTFYNGDNDFARSFSLDVFNNADLMKFGNVKIAVFEADNPDAVNEVKDELPSYAIRRLEGYIREARDFLAEIKSGKRTEINAKWIISRKNSAIDGWNKEISDFKTKYFEFDPQVTGGEGYGKTISLGGSREDNYSELRAFITHGRYISMFESVRPLAAMSKKNHAEEFARFLRNFRPRAEHEIPTELGVCIPYGFIRDNGRTLVDIKQSFRIPDAMGVLYTIHTGSNERLRRSSVREATSFASVGKMDTKEDLQVDPFITERINPRPYKIGGVTALQGGVAAKIVKAGTPSYETYQVFTGYSGWPGVEALPFIFVELNTTTMFMASELKQNPPPFKTSWGRLETLLRSIRLRPTSPTMPDFAAAGVK